MKATAGIRKRTTNRKPQRLGWQVTPLGPTPCTAPGLSRISAATPQLPKLRPLRTCDFLPHETNPTTPPPPPRPRPEPRVFASLHPLLRASKQAPAQSATSARVPLDLHFLLHGVTGPLVRLTQRPSWVFPPQAFARTSPYFSDAPPAVAHPPRASHPLLLDSPRCSASCPRQTASGAALSRQQYQSTTREGGLQTLATFVATRKQLR